MDEFPAGEVKNLVLVLIVFLFKKKLMKSVWGSDFAGAQTPIKLAAPYRIFPLQQEGKYVFSKTFKINTSRMDFRRAHTSHSTHHAGGMVESNLECEWKLYYPQTIYSNGWKLKITRKWKWKEKMNLNQTSRFLGFQMFVFGTCVIFHLPGFGGHFVV